MVVDTRTRNWGFLNWDLCGWGIGCGQGVGEGCGAGAGGGSNEGEFGDGDGGLDEGGEDPGGAIGELDLEPVAGLVAAEEGGGFVLVEAGDDGEVGAGAGAEVGAFDEDGDCGPGYFGGRGGRGGGGAGVRGRGGRGSGGR